MSLINQMLRDLEARRGGETRDEALLQGVSAGSRRRGSRALVPLLSATVILLLIAVGYLAWGRHGAPSAPETKTVASAKTKVPLPAAPSHPSVPATGRTTVPPSVSAPSAGPAASADTVAKPRHKPVPTPTTGATDGKGDNRTPSKTRSVDAPPPARPAEKRKTPVATAKRNTHAAPSASGDRGEIRVHRHPRSPAQQAAVEYQQAYAMLQAGHRGGAEKRLRKALRIDPSHIQSREVLAGLLIASGRVVEAGNLLRKGLQLHPHYSKFAMLYARVLVQQQQLPAAVRVLEKGRSANSPPDYQAFLAALYQREGHYSKSVSAYRRALEAAPGQAVWWMGLGISLENAGDPEQADKAYKQALQQGISGELRRYVEKRHRALGDG